MSEDVRKKAIHCKHLIKRGDGLKMTAPSFGLVIGLTFFKPLSGAAVIPWPFFDTAMKDTRAKKRPDQSGTHRTTYDRNKQRIYSTQSICGICGLPVDFSVKYPHPLSPCIDHIIPIAKGGHPSDIQNLQLAHWICNRLKSDKLVIKKEDQKKEVGNFDIPWSLDWESYRS